MLTLTLGGTGAGRTIFTIEPANNQTGPVTITITVDDATGTNNGIILKISVGNVWFGYTNELEHRFKLGQLHYLLLLFGAIIPASPLGGNYPVIKYRCFGLMI